MGKFRSALNLVLILFLLAAALPTVSVAAQAGTPQTGGAPVSLTLADFGYEDLTLTSPFGSASYSIGLPNHWQIQPGATIDLDITYVAGRPTVVSTDNSGNQRTTLFAQANMQVILNDQTIYRASLDNITRQTIHIDLPDIWPKRTGTYDRLDILFRMDGTCEYVIYDTLSIAKTSRIGFQYKDSPLALDLSQYPLPFYQRTFLPNVVDMVVSEKASPTQVSAALSVAAGLGRATNKRLKIDTVTDPGWEKLTTPPAEHLMVVGTPENLSMIQKLNDQDLLPVKLQKRSLQLISSGPSLVLPDSTASYQFEVTNTGADKQDGLSVRAWLPLQAADVQCLPGGCTPTPGLVTWPVSSLDAGAKTSYTLTFKLPAKNAPANLRINAELDRNQAPINVSTLITPLASTGEVTTVQAKPASPFFFMLNGAALPENDGILQLIASPWKPDKAIMLVTGLSDEAVMKAGNALGSSATFPGMKGPYAVIENILPGETAVPEKIDFTFKDLGYTELVYSGVGIKEVYYNFELPINWNLNGDAYARLLFSHSNMLDPKKSSITMLFNDKPVAMTALDKSNVQKGELKATLPVENARPGLTNSLLVRVESRLDDPCVDPQTPQSWVSVSADSTLHLSHADGDIRDFMNLDYWPRPFVTQRSNLSGLLISLPEQPTQEEYSVAFQTIGFLGSFSDASQFLPTVVLGKIPDSIDSTQFNILAIGRPTRNPLIASMNDTLPQPFQPGTDAIEQKIDKIIFRLPPDLSLGYLMLASSPSNADRPVLAITGTTDQGMLTAAQWLIDSTQAWALKGDLALIRDNQIFTTDTRVLDKQSPQEMVATVVPEAAAVGTATPTAETKANQQVTAVIEATAVNNVSPQQGGPSYLLPLVIGITVLAVLGALIWVFFYRKPGM